MHMHPYSLLVGVILVASIGCQGAISHEDHSQALRETREAAAQAIAEGDVERLFSYWTPPLMQTRSMRVIVL